jgi:nucleotidyltransferase substrate binding protein (TIGR01987 family)
MSAPHLDLSNLHKALAQLEEAHAFWLDLEDGDKLKPHLRSAVIQSFETTYELSVRSVRRALLERAESADSVKDLSYNDVLRRALDAGLAMDFDTWRSWRDMRNGTSHAYEEERAQDMAERAIAFIADVHTLLPGLVAMAMPSA